MEQLRDLNLGVLRGHRQYPLVHRLIPDAVLGVLARPSLHVHVRAAKKSRLAIDDVRLAIVEACHEDLRRREANDDRAAKIAADVLLLALRQGASGNHLAGSPTRELI